MEEAILLFAERGFRGTTTRELARACGITEPVLYQHFRTKSDLYRAILEVKMREGQEVFDRVLGPHLESDDDEAFFAALAGLIFDRHERDSSFFRLLMYSALERHELAAMFFQEQHVPCYGIISGYIRRRMKAGAFRKIDPLLAARQFMGMVAHHCMVRSLFGDNLVRASRKRAISEMVRTFLCGVASNKRKPRT